MRDGDDLGLGRMFPDQFRRSGIVHHDRARAFCEPLQHGIAKVPLVGGRGCPIAPQLLRTIPIPLAVVKNKFVDIGGFRQTAKKQMLQHCVVQDRYAWTLNGLPIDRAVQLIVADVVKMHVGVSPIGWTFAQLLERSQQCCRVVRHSGTRRRERRMEAHRHAFFLRFPTAPSLPGRT